MPIIFEASAKSSILYKSLNLLVCIIVFGLFAGAAWAFAGAAWAFDGIFARVVFAFSMIICLAVGKSVVGDLIAYTKADGGWHVEIDNFTLTWKSPVEKLFRSFRIKLSDIDHLQFVQIRSGGTKSKSHKREFYIHLKNGKSMNIPAQEGGIWVNDVFEALEKKHIRYDRDHLRREKFGEIKKGFDILPMKAWE